MMRPKSSGLMICPVFGAMLDDGMALKLLIGLAKFTWLNLLGLTSDSIFRNVEP